MKLIWTVCVTWSILYAAEAIVTDLQCWTCVDFTDVQCTITVLKNCTDDDAVCITSSLTSTAGPRSIRKHCTRVKRCGAHKIDEEFKPLLANMGQGDAASSGICCNTSGCNNKTYDLPEDLRNLRFNGLRCISCHGPFDLARCDRIMWCRGKRNVCVNATLITPNGRIQRNNGCTTSDWCKGTFLHITYFSPLITITTFIDGPTCCNHDYCNGNFSKLNPNDPLLLPIGFQPSPPPLIASSTIPLLSTHILSIFPLTLLLCTLIV